MTLASKVNDKIYESQECREESKDIVTESLKNNALSVGFESVEICDITNEKPPVPAPPPTREEIIKTLQAQVSAGIQSNSFLEECIVEMAGIVYAG